jgi:hypothetical protein
VRLRDQRPADVVRSHPDRLEAEKKQLASLTPKRCKMDNTIGNSNDLMFDGMLNGDIAAAGKLCAQADRISSARPVT